MILLSPVQTVLYRMPCKWSLNIDLWYYISESGNEMKDANINKYDHKIVRITDTGGKIFTGEAGFVSAEYAFHEYGKEKDALELNGYTIFEDAIEKIEVLKGMEVIRAQELWQQAGAYYVRIRGMAKKHHITLKQEFDEHDTPDTKYIVINEDDFPIATARMYPLDHESVMIGRVVVLPEYRRLGIGTMVVTECEAWAEDLGYSRFVVDSRDNKVEFYEQLGYEVCGRTSPGDTFRCIRMEKRL